MKSPILVVGAGPVGLTAALSLSRFGIPVRIIDRNEAATTLSKALVLWRRSLITLDPMIPLETWLGLGLVPKGLRLHDQGAYQATMTLENAGHILPPGLLIPQSEVEATLIAALGKFGVAVERQTSLDSFEQHPDRIVCKLTTPHGPETIETPYLFGCDGAHSTVRHSLHLDFPGEALAQRWLLGDIEVEIEDGINPNAPKSDLERTVDHGWIYSSSSDHGSFALFPITDSRYRLFAESGMVTPETTRKDPTVEDLQNTIFERTRLQWKITKSHWLAEFRISERQVPSYVHGRVFLAGDAAHVHSPAGGQGMNTGIQDAANLAWKVALACRGTASSDLIATYQEERHPVAARVLKMSGRAIRMAMSTDRLRRGVQDVVMAALTNIPQFRKAATTILSEDDVAYLNSSLAGGKEGVAKPGSALPDVPIEINGEPCSSTRLLRPTKPGSVYTLILMPEAQPDIWISSPLIEVRRWNQDFQDPAGHLQKALGLHAASGLLVRPDAILATAGSPAAIQAWFDEWMLPDKPGAA